MCCVSVLVENVEEKKVKKERNKTRSKLFFYIYLFSCCSIGSSRPVKVMEKESLSDVQSTDVSLEGNKTPAREIYFPLKRLI